jgi:hypothetical protein
MPSSHPPFIHDSLEGNPSRGYHGGYLNGETLINNGLEKFRNPSTPAAGTRKARFYGLFKFLRELPGVTFILCKPN